MRQSRSRAYSLPISELRYLQLPQGIIRAASDMRGGNYGLAVEVDGRLPDNSAPGKVRAILWGGDLSAVVVAAMLLLLLRRQRSPRVMRGAAVLVLLWAGGMVLMEQWAIPRIQPTVLTAMPTPIAVQMSWPVWIAAIPALGGLVGVGVLVLSFLPAPVRGWPGGFRG